MAAIVIKNGKKTIQTDVGEFVVGTSPSCLVVLNDPVAAGSHARFTRREGLYFVDDAGTASGTWKNGQAVTKPERLADGDVIVVGCTKLGIKISPAAEGSQLAIDVREKVFHFELSTRRKVVIGGEEKTVVSGDAERWVRDEVAFGRFRTLFGLNVLALAAAIALLVLVCVGTTRARVLQPGPLHARHAQLFDSHAVVQASAGFAAGTSIANEHSCSACHDAFGGTPTSKCAACHATIMSATHPFALDASEALPPGTAPLNSEWCSRCHVDHEGDAWVAPQLATALGQACTSCHASGPPPLARRRLSTVPMRDETLAYAAFGHSSHAAVKCDACHAERTSETQRSVTDRDFVVVPFERCMACHSKTDVVTPDSQWARDPALASLGGGVKPEHQARLRWHGSKEAEGSRCLACHEQLFDGRLRQTTALDVDALFALKSRGHAEFFGVHSVPVSDAQGRPRACIECHVDDRPHHAGVELAARPFWHALHLRSIPPDDSTADRSKVCAECLDCHSELRDSTALTGRKGSATDDLSGIPTYLGSDTKSCAQCHREGVGEALAVRTVGSSMGASPRVRAEFPHKFHLDFGQPSLKEGCFTCHTFSKPDALSAGARAITRSPEKMAQCLDCHAEHRDVGGSGCELCHPSVAGRADSAYFGPTGPAGTSRPDPRRTKSRPDTTGFSHWSAGHRPSMESHACETCHAGTQTATSLAGVAMPSELDASCQHCHVEEKRQFHWRGEPTDRWKSAHPH